MSAETVQWYRSKVDWWLVPILGFAPVLTVGVFVALILTGDPYAWIAGIFPILLIAGIYFGLVFPLKYGLSDTQLIVRFGVCRKRIALADVSEVHRTFNPLSSPALSLDRLWVQYGKGLFGAVMISPADRDRFLDELARKAGLKREGDRLFRSSSEVG